MSSTQAPHNTADRDLNATAGDNSEMTISDDPKVKALVKPSFFSRWKLVIGMVIYAIVMFMAPLYLDAATLTNGQTIMTAAVGGFGLTMLLGQAGLLSLAQSAFMLVGAIAYTTLAAETQYAPGSETEIYHFGLGWPPLLALIVAVGIAGLAGGLFAPISARLRGIYLGLASLALVYIMFYVSKTFPAIAGHASGRPVPGFSLFGFNVVESSPELYVMNVPIGTSERQWWLFAILMGIAYVLARGAINGRIGRSWRAVRDNEAAATVMGVNVARTKAGVFIISSAYAGLSGIMTVWMLQLLTPDESAEVGKFSLVTSISYLALVVIGGMGSLLGAVLGAVIVFGMPPILNAAMQGGGSAVTSGTAFSPTVIATFIYGALIVLIIMFEPRGFAGIGNRILGLFTGRNKPVGSEGDQPGAKEVDPADDEAEGQASPFQK